jgi:hypothetical protein
MRDPGLDHQSFFLSELAQATTQQQQDQSVSENNGDTAAQVRAVRGNALRDGRRSAVVVTGM